MSWSAHSRTIQIQVAPPPSTRVFMENYLIIRATDWMEIAINKFYQTNSKVLQRYFCLYMIFYETSSRYHIYYEHMHFFNLWNCIKKYPNKLTFCGTLSSLDQASYKENLPAIPQEDKIILFSCSFHKLHTSHHNPFLYSCNNC